MAVYNGNITALLTKQQAEEVQATLKPRRGMKENDVIPAEIRVSFSIKPVVGYTVDFSHNGETIGKGIVTSTKGRSAIVRY